MNHQYIALSWFLILVSVGIIILISVIIIIKRGVARRKSRIDRCIYTPCGHGLSKTWKEAIERQLNSTVRIRTEPRVFGSHYENNWDSYMTSNTVTFLHRAKAVDEFLKLKESILHLEPILEAPPTRGIHAFLMSARDRVMHPPAPRELIEEYCHLYLWARLEMKPFGEEQYDRLCHLQNGLMEFISRAATLRELQNTTPLTSSSHQRRNSLKSSLNRLTTVNHPKTATSRCTEASKMQSSGGRAGSVSLKRLTRRKGRHHCHERLVGDTNLSEPRVVHSKVMNETTTTAMRSPLIPSNSPGGSNPDSSQSDDSQTALIELDRTVLQTVPRGTLPSGPRPCANEAFGCVEQHLIQPDPTHADNQRPQSAESSCSQ